jgi:hypothetical protein
MRVMKSQYDHKPLLVSRLVRALLMVWVTGVTHAQGLPPTAFTGGPSIAPQSKALAIAEGDVTNGLRSVVSVLPPSQGAGAHTICVFLTNTNAGERVILQGSGTNFVLSLLAKAQSPEWLYYKPTNSFCGPIEMRDPQGQKVLLLKPQLSQPEAYPAQYSWNAEHSRMLTGVYLGSGLVPEPLLGRSASSEMGRFRLDKYFGLTEPGEYTLTVWPKVYKRSQKDKDICERIDVPPVSVTFKWEPNPK